MHSLQILFIYSLNLSFFFAFGTMLCDFRLIIIALLQKYLGQLIDWLEQNNINIMSLQNDTFPISRLYYILNGLLLLLKLFHVFWKNIRIMFSDALRQCYEYSNGRCHVERRTMFPMVWVEMFVYKHAVDHHHTEKQKKININVICYAFLSFKSIQDVNRIMKEQNFWLDFEFR